MFSEELLNHVESGNVLQMNLKDYIMQGLRRGTSSTSRLIDGTGDRRTLSCCICYEDFNENSSDMVKISFNHPNECICKDCWMKLQDHGMDNCPLCRGTACFNTK